MSDPRISYICPTLGRSTLTRMLDSLVHQLSEHDELFVVADGYRNAGKYIEPYHRKGIYYLEIPFVKETYGAGPIDHAMPLVNGDYVAFIGDDDYATSDALESIRLGLLQGPDHHPHLFAMECLGRILSHSLERLDVSGQQIVVPAQGCPRYGQEPLLLSDWNFIKAVDRQWGGLTCHDEVIAVMPQRGEGVVW
jgi:hypothetical protein